MEGLTLGTIRTIFYGFSLRKLQRSEEIDDEEYEFLRVTNRQLRNKLEFLVIVDIDKDPHYVTYYIAFKDSLNRDEEYSEIPFKEWIKRFDSEKISSMNISLKEVQEKLKITEKVRWFNINNDDCEPEIFDDYFDDFEPYPYDHFIKE